MGRGWGKVLRGWGGDGNLKTSRGAGTGGVKVTYCGDGAGMGLIRLLRGGNGVKTLTPCHSLLVTSGIGLSITCRAISIYIPAVSLDKIRGHSGLKHKLTEKA